MTNKTYYKPLPDCLTISKSEIHGLGLFATEFVESGTNFGITHVKDERFPPDNYIRTSLGGYFNHSETPNCKVVYEGDFIYLVAIEGIEIGSELTAKYSFYDPTK